MNSDWLARDTKSNLGELLKIHMERNRLLNTEFGPIYEASMDEWNALRWLMPLDVSDNERTWEEVTEDDMIDLGYFREVPVWWNRRLEPDAG
jgi:hypothetical protein